MCVMMELPEELQAQIAAYLDGQLPSDEAAALEVYLANADPVLAECIARMHADKALLQALPRPRAPQELAGRITEQIERQSLLRAPELPVRTPWWQSRSAIAAGLAVVVGAFSYFVASSVSRPPAEPSWATRDKSANRQLADARTSTEVSMPAPLSYKDAMSSTNIAAATPPPQIARGGADVPAPAAAPPIAATPTAVPKPDATPGSLGAEIAAAGSTPVPNMPRTDELRTAPEPPAGRALEPGELGTGGAGFGGRGGAGGGMGGGGFGGFGGGMGGFAGGGGGGRSGAIGGRGGAGRGGRTPSSVAGPTAASTTPTNDAATKNFTATTTNPAQALADLTRDGSGPLLITFYARNDADYGNLASALATYAGANATVQRRAAAEGQTPAALETTPNAPVPSAPQPQSTTQGGPYRIALRPEQLQTLAQSYRLAIVARAGDVVQIRDAETASTRAADTEEHAGPLQKAAGGEALPATAPPTPNQADTAPTATPTTIDCVINMQPAPRAGP
jgi:hypothetical protein